MIADYTRDVYRLLAKHGCTFVRRGKGDHNIYYSPITLKESPVMRDNCNEDDGEAMHGSKMYLEEKPCLIEQISRHPQQGIQR